MAAVSPLFCVSSPESSPVKLEGPGFVVYRVCKRIRDTGDLICPLQSAASPSVPLIVVDDDDAPSQPHPTSLLSQQGCIELVDAGEWKAANLRPKRARDSSTKSRGPSKKKKKGDKRPAWAPF